MELAGIHSAHLRHTLSIVRHLTLQVPTPL
jgi:hypothetical protein